MIPDEAPLWIIVCNFQTFEIHNMNKPTETPIVILLDEVRNKYFLFDFMFKKDVKEISYEIKTSLKAGEIVGILKENLYSVRAVTDHRGKVWTVFLCFGKLLEKER